MKFYGNDIVEIIRKERKKGLSLRYLEKNFNIPSSTLSRWTKDIPSANHNYISSKNNYHSWKKKYRKISKNFTYDKDHSKILIALLYWCEGSKYPSTNCVAFSNSDFKLVKFFLDLLRKGFNIEEKKLRVRLQIHTNHDYKNLLDYWSKGLKIDTAYFNKPTITTPNNKRKRKEYMGTCTIKYYDVKLLLNLMGIYEALTGEVA